MIRSMTGFGMGKARSEYGVATVEIKTVNHKFLEISSKLPNNLQIFEDRVKEILQKDIKRGKVYFNLMYEGISPANDLVYLDMSLAKSYYKKLEQLKNTFKIKEAISLKDITSFPGVLNFRVTENEASKLWPVAAKAIAAAVKKLIYERSREGKHLAQDLSKRISIIKGHLASIKVKAHVNVKNYKRKLEDRITEISKTPPVNKDRLEMEAALYAKNSDISEEITRLSGHVINCEKIIKKGEEAGKKLDFVAQEMHREINTIGSKSSDYTISTSVIEIKSEVERIREQVKNIE